MTEQQRAKNRAEWEELLSRPPPEDKGKIWGMCFFLGLLVMFLLAALMGDGSKGSSESLQNTALKKIDKGQELNYFEKKSLEHIFPK